MKKNILNPIFKWKGPKKTVPFPALPSTSRLTNPILSGNRLFVSSFKSQKIIAIDAKSGHLTWECSVGEGASTPPSKLGQTIIASTSSGVFCIQATSGEVLWKYEPYDREQESFYSEAVVDKKNIYIADRYGNVHCLKAKDGKIEWKERISEVGINATALVKDNFIYVVSLVGELFCIDAHSGTKIWCIFLKEGSIRQPILSGNKLYIQGNTFVFIINLTNRKVEKYKFRNIVDILVDGKRIFVIDKTVRGGVSKHYLKIFSSGKVQSLLILANYPQGFAPVDNSKYLLIFGGSALIFYDLKKNSKMTIPGIFSAPPVVKGNLIYVVGFEREADCYEVDFLK